MAKRPPERYNPGELDRTRQNLGSVTDEEARRLSQLLGGEVGIEKTAHEVDEKYQQLQQLNRRRSDRVIYDSAVVEPTGSKPAAITRRFDEDEQRELRYRDRVRMDFLAARPEHGIKTLGNAVASLFSGLFEVTDSIHPRFITHGDTIFFRHIENLVVSVRGLLALNRRHPENRLRVPFYRTILEVIKGWDIEGLHAELSRLQVSPRRLTFRYCGTLARMIFVPIYRLTDIDPVHHLRGALKRLYDLNILSLPKEHTDIERVKRYYHEAVYEVEQVFGPLKFRLFPFLEKMCSTRYRPTDEFYLQNREEIITFLSLDPKEIIAMPAAPDAGAAQPETAEPVEDEEEPVLESPRNQKGLEVLERLFPTAGWDHLDQFPDLYGHVHPVIQFPQGFELVRPDDPLHQVVVLVSILQECFYGFRHIQFGVLHESIGAELGTNIHRAIEGWRIIHDEFVGRTCLPQLREYCREIERNPGFPETDYGKKARRNLLWQKKQHLLPHLSVHRGGASDARSTVPKLHELSAELLELLSAVSVDLAGSERNAVRSVRNPWDRFVFDIETPLTRRIAVVMRRYREEPNNANLLLYAFSILTLLDSLISDEASFYYPFPVEPLYRTQSPDTSAPQYEIPTVDSDAIFRQAERDVPPPNEEHTTTGDQRPAPDELTGLTARRGLELLLDREIGRLRNDQRVFSVVVLIPVGFDTYYTESGEEAGVSLLQSIAGVIKHEIREYRDVACRIESSCFPIVMPDTTRDEATHLALRVFVSWTKTRPVSVPISAVIVESHRTWSRDRAMRIIRRSAEAAAGETPPTVLVYDEKDNEFTSLRDLPNTDA